MEKRDFFSFDEVWGRVCAGTGWHKYSELANFLKIKASTVSGSKNRGVFPMEWAFKIAQHHGLSTDWLLSGDGEASRRNGESTVCEFQTLETVIIAVERLFLRNDEKGLSPEKKAKLIIILYKDVCRGEVSAERIDEKVIELISLAS